MFKSLSETQRKIVFEKTGRLAVRACPGSGKTYSVAARLAYRIANWSKPNSGIAAISFTNVAWEEISVKLADNFKIPSVGYPHFLGTIDSFINNYIFLPHGHLAMSCNKRPVLVGEPHSIWSIKRYDNDYDQYFDIVSYDAGENLIYPEIQGVFFFGYNKIFKQDGTESQHALHLRTMKQKYWRLGYANQHDANYFALSVLKRYPQVAKSIVHRFHEIILDEAQDTNEVQMQILEILCHNGLDDLLFVGDPDQAIFEWNKAKPKLFQIKFEQWKENSLTLNENRRSSKKICSSTYNLSTLSAISEAIDETVKDFDSDPEIVVYDIANVQRTIDTFINKCKQNDIEINPKNIAVIYRSKNFINAILGNPPVADLEWTNDKKLTYPLLHASFLLSNGFAKKAYKILELAFARLSIHKDIISKVDLDLYIESIGFTKHRSVLASIFKKLPIPRGPLDKWMNEANKILKDLGINLSFLAEAKDMLIERLFSIAADEIPYLDFSTGTVHSVKGETFEAVLIFLKTRGIGKKYTTLIREALASDESEELRIVYVGITRPKKLLTIAVPDQLNKNAWEQKLKI